jgi:hypothetical protein
MLDMCCRVPGAAAAAPIRLLCCCAEKERKKVSELTCLCCLSILAAELGRLCWNEGAILKFNIWVVAIHLPACMHLYVFHPSQPSDQNHDPSTRLAQ